MVCERKFPLSKGGAGGRRPPPPLWGSAAAEYGCLMTEQENERGAPKARKTSGHFVQRCRRPRASTFAVLALGVSNILFLLSYGRDFMQAQVKYKSEVKTAVLGDRTITVKNLIPVFSPQEQDKQSREVERRLFDVFRKYAGQRG